MDAPYDVIVVGAGIGGTAFALAAARDGRRVAILEKEIDPRKTLLRPEVLWGASLRALDELGVGKAVRADAATPLRAMEVRHARRDLRLLRLDISDERNARVAPWGTDPAATRKILLDAAIATGRVEHLPGWRATGLERKAGRVTTVTGRTTTGEFAVEGRFIVGDDGSRSVIREAAGIRLDVDPFPVEFILATAPRPAGLPAEEARVFLDPSGFRSGIFAALLVPMGRERIGVAFPARHGTFAFLREAPAGTLESRVASLLPEAMRPSFEPSFPQGFGVAVRPVGHAEAYWKPGLALLGDAIHPVSPAGGQGANMALADALALRDTVLATTRPGETPADTALAAYEAHRRAGNERSIAISRRAAVVLRPLLAMPPLAAALPGVLALIDRSPREKARFLAFLASAFQGEQETRG
jgi:2-polyprenyl-6-methoxyphenol hydroxylase-like FAD-dependent oxidoreductase